MIRINIPETEEIADFLLSSRRGDALDVNNVASRHVIRLIGKYQVILVWLCEILIELMVRM